MNCRIVLSLVLALISVVVIDAQSDPKLAETIEKEFKRPLSKIGNRDIYIKSNKPILSEKEISALKHMIDEKGYPTNSMVGEIVAHRFWTLVMQCNEDAPFQMNVLKRMHSAMERGEDINKNDFAMLVDRVLMNRQKPQLYGTQYVVSKENGEAKLYRIKTPEKLQERRKSLNLPDAMPEKTKIIPKVKGTAQRGKPNKRY